MAYPFLQARHYQAANRGPGDVDWIVIHCTESGESEKGAENTAGYFATTDRAASAHYTVDGSVNESNAIWQSVLEHDVAYGAKSANRRGIHIEQVGRAAQTRLEWIDAYGQRMIPRVAQLVREIAARWDVPLKFIDAAGLLAGRRGITTHAEVSKAWPSSGHTDPGANYPLDILFAHIQGDDMPLSNEDLDKIGLRVKQEVVALTEGDLVLQRWHKELLTRLDKIIAGIGTTAGGGISPAKLARASKAFVDDLAKP